MCFAHTHVCLCARLVPLHWLGAGTAQKRADKKGNLNSINASRLAFHTDQGATDLIALVSVTAAPEGGESKWVSAIAIHNELLRRGRKVHTVSTFCGCALPGTSNTLSSVGLCHSHLQRAAAQRPQGTHSINLLWLCIPRIRHAVLKLSKRSVQTMHSSKATSGVLSRCIG